MGSSQDRNPVEELAEEYLDRKRRGERPQVTEYTEKYPDWAEEIEDLFPALELMEELKPLSDDLSDGQEDSAADSIPQLRQVGDYRILRQIGRGGMGIVYEAEQQSLGRRVALKVLPRSAAGDEKAFTRFQREARAAARMHHTNIVPVFEVGQDQEHVFYAMQLIQGQGLDDVIADLKQLRDDSRAEGQESVQPIKDSPHQLAASLVTGRFQHENLLENDSDESSQADNGPHAETVLKAYVSTVSAVLPGQSELSSADTNPTAYYQSVAEIGLQSARALSYAHARGIIHRDIKPSNLLLDSTGVVWITDFGLAKTGDAGLTHTGDILGTIRYMSPERFKGHCDVRADVYSLGLTLYELLALKPAFESPDRLKLIDMVSKTDVVPPRALDPRVPRDLETIVLKACDKDPKRRYQSADDMAEDLQRFIDDEPIKARRVTSFEQLARWGRRNKGLASALSVVAGLLMVLAIGSTIAAGYFRDLSGKYWSANEELKKEKLNADRQAEENKELASDLKTSLEAEQKSSKAAQLNADLVSLNLAYRWLTTPGRFLYGKALLEKLQLRFAESKTWENVYHLLNSLPERSPGRILYKFSQNVTDVSFSPTGQYIAAMDLSGLVVILDAKTGSVFRQFPLQSHSHKFVWSPDGRQLALSEYNGDVCIVDLETGVHRHFSTGSSRSYCVAWAPDGERIVTGGRTGLVQIWNTRLWRLEQTFKGHKTGIIDVDWSCDNRLASAERSGRVIVWDIQTGESLEMQNEEAGSFRLESVSFSPDGKRLAVAKRIPQAGSIVLWDIDTGKQMESVPAPSDISHATWSHDGTRLAMATYTSPVTEIWDLTANKPLHRFVGYAFRTVRCSWSPDDLQLAACEGDTVRVWDLHRDEVRLDFDGNQSTVRGLAWSPSGAHFATAGYDSTVDIWDVRTRKNVCVFEDHRTPVLGVDWHPSENRLVSFDHKSVMILEWKIDENGDVIKNVKEMPIASPTEYISDACWSANGERLAAAMHVHNRKPNDTMVRIYDPRTGEMLHGFQLQEAGSVSWRQDSKGRSLLAAVGRTELKVWDTETKEEVYSFPMEVPSFYRISLSPDCQRLAFSGFANREKFDDITGLKQILGIIDLKTQQKLTLRGHESRVFPLSWTSTGTQLLTAAFDGTAILWDAVTGEQLLALDKQDGYSFYAASFSPDDLKLALAGTAPGVLLLDATPSYDAAPSYLPETSDKLLQGLQKRIAELPTQADIEDLLFRGRIRAKRGELKEAVEDFKLAATLSRAEGASLPLQETVWWVAGPYDRELLDRPPHELEGDPSQPIPTADGVVVTTLPFSPKLNLGDLFDHQQNISAFAMTRIYSVEDQTVGLLMGSDDHVRVWLNGQVIHSYEKGRAALRDEDAIEITLEGGKWNNLTFQVGNYAGEHGLFARLSREPRELALAFERNRKWENALDWWGRARDRYPNDVAILLSHGHAALKLGQRTLAGESFDRAIELLGDNVSGARGVAQWYLEDVRSLVGLARFEETAHSLQHALELYEKLRACGSFDERDAGGLAEILLIQELLNNFKSGSEIKLLKPIELKSEGGATLRRLLDGSILAVGTLPQQEVYTITVRSPQQEEITCIALELLPHESLPFGNMGRETRLGNFLISKFEVSLRQGNEAELIKLPIGRIRSDFAARKYVPTSRIENMLGRGPAQHWNAWPDLHIPHRIIFELEKPIKIGDNSELQITIDCRDKDGPNHALGCFRLSYGRSENAFSQEELRCEAMQRLNPALGIVNGWERLAATYHLLGRIEDRDRVFAECPEAAVGVASLSIKTANWPDAIDWTHKAIHADLISENHVDRLAEHRWFGDSWDKFTDELRITLNEQTDSTEKEHLKAELRRYVNALVVSNMKHKAIDLLSLLIEADPESYDLYLHRGELHVIKGYWQEAALDLAEAINLDSQQSGPDADDRSRIGGTAVGPRYMLAGALAALGEEEKYREHCRTYLEQFHEASDLQAGRALMSSLWLPGTLTEKEYRQLEPLADRTLADLFRRETIKGIYYFRAGRNPDALDWIPRQLSVAPNWEKARGLLFWAMALYKDEQHLLANQKLDEAENLLEAALENLLKDGSLGSVDWMIVYAVRREAVEMIRGAEASVRREAKELSFLGRLLTRRKQWAEALPYLQRVVELDPDNTIHWLRVAPLLVQTGDMEGYHKHCREMLKRFGGRNDRETNFFTYERTAKSCLLLAETSEDLKSVFELADITSSERKNETSSRYFQFVRALADVRRGDFPSAIQISKQLSLEIDRTDSLGAMNHALLAIAYRGNNQPELARETLGQANELVDSLLATNHTKVNVHDILIAEILRREAEKLMNPVPGE